MNGWNRLFAVVAVCWAIVAPFLLMADTNKPTKQVFDSCSSVAYHRYGSSDSVRLDWNKYQSEQVACLDAYVRAVLVLPKVLSAMVGAGDLTLGLIAWAFILIPLGLLWVVGWALGRIVLWVAAAFRR
jgi:hypothetical protein